MPHQCVRCNKFYEDGSSVILKGCDCGGRLFFFIKKEKMEDAKKLTEQVQLSQEQKLQMESDVFELMGHEPSDEPVVLDLEAIRVTQPGKYELDLVHLFQGEPLVFKLEEGKYIVDIVESFKQFRKK